MSRKALDRFIGKEWRICEFRHSFFVVHPYTVIVATGGAANQRRNAS